MTNNDVVKALGCCIKPTSDCDNCPAHNVVDDENCFDVVKQGALNLINRQQMTIESISRKAKAEITILLSEREVAKNEVDSLSVMVIELQNQLKTAKAEIEMNDAEIKELRIALQGYLDDVTKARNLYKQSIEELNQANAEIERLEAERMMADGYADALEEQAKTEAYREFAERLNKEFDEQRREYRNVLNSDGACAMIIAIKTTNNLLKELEGDNGQSEVALACDAVVNDSPVDCQSRGGIEHRSARPPVHTSEMEAGEDG